MWGLDHGRAEQRGQPHACGQARWAVIFTVGQVASSVIDTLVSFVSIPGKLLDQMTNSMVVRGTKASGDPGN